MVASALSLYIDLMANKPSDKWYFAAEIDRGALRVRAIVGWAFSILFCSLAAGAIESQQALAAAVGVLAAVGFGLAALVTWRRSQIAGSPLVLTERGLELDDGLGTRLRFAWDQVEGVQLASFLSGKRVRLEIRGAEPGDVGLLVLPRLCQGDAPAEWLAGLIETFRQHALHPQG